MLWGWHSTPNQRQQRKICILYHTTLILKCCFKPTHKKKTWFIQWSACSIHFHLGMTKKTSLALDDTSPSKLPCVLAKSPWNHNEAPHFCRHPLTAPWFLPSFHAIQSCFAAAQAVANSVAHKNNRRIRHQATCPTPADARWHWGKAEKNENPSNSIYVYIYIYIISIYLYIYIYIHTLHLYSIYNHLMVGTLSSMGNVWKFHQGGGSSHLTYSFHGVSGFPLLRTPWR